jgi:hypothetical protein
MGENSPNLVTLLAVQWRRLTHSLMLNYVNDPSPGIHRDAGMHLIKTGMWKKFKSDIQAPPSSVFCSSNFFSPQKVLFFTPIFFFFSSFLPLFLCFPCFPLGLISCTLWNLRHSVSPFIQEHLFHVFIVKFVKMYTCAFTCTYVYKKCLCAVIGINLCTAIITRLFFIVKIFNIVNTFSLNTNTHRTSCQLQESNILKDWPRALWFFSAWHGIRPTETTGLPTKNFANHFYLPTEDSWVGIRNRIAELS